MSTEIDLSAALRTVAERMAARPWTTGIEAAFRELADELERVSSGLDPEPYIHVERDVRVAAELIPFIGRGAVRFAPREDYNQNEADYVRS